MAERKTFLFLSHDNKIGDAIVLTGLLAPIKARWPDARIGVVCGQTNAVVYQAHPLVDQLHVARSRSVLARMLAGLSARRKAYAQLVHFGSDVDSRSLRTLVRLAGATECVLLFEPSQPFATRQHVLASDWLQRHTCERHLRYLQWLGLPQASYRYDLRLMPSAASEAEELVAGHMPHVVIACDASTADRSFDTGWLQQCCTRLLQADSTLRITLLCTGQSRHDALAAMVRAVPGGAVQLAPLRPDAGLALALIAKADLLLSPDTFAVHAASAFNIPVVAAYPGDAHTLVTWAPRSALYLQRVAAPGAALSTHDPQAIAKDCLALLQQSRESKPPSP